MVVDIIARKASITIDGLDVSEAVTALVWGFTDYESQSGIIKTEGSITLSGAGLDWTEDLDDRTNARWSRGKTVRVQVDNESSVLTTPVCGGWMYILKSQWDGDKLLTIQVGCLLSLMDSPTPPGEGLEGFAVGTTQSATDLFGRLGAKLGATINGTLSGFTLNKPLSKLNNNSYSKQLGQLCWANGRIAYVDGRDGEIYVVPVNIAPSPILDRWVCQDAVSYGRRTGVEAPCEKVLVTGTRVNAVATEDQVNAEPTESFGPASIVNPDVGSATIRLERRTETEEINRSSRTITKFTQIQQPYGLAVGALPIPDTYLPDDEDRQTKWDATQAAKALNFVIGSETTEVSQYERLTFSGSGVPKIDERRMVSKETLGKRQAELVYQSYNEARVGSFGDEEYNGSRITTTGLIDSDRTLETYTYRATSQSSGNDSSITVIRGDRPVLEILTETFQRRAEVFPDAAMGNPTAWQFTKRERKYWVQDPNSEGYIQYTETETPALSETTNDITDYTNIDSVATTAKRTVVPSKGARVQPPKPQTFPVDAITEQVQIVGIALLPGLSVPAVREREREYRAEVGTIQSTAQAERVARIEGAILWGRYNGCDFEMNLADRLLTASPLQAIDWTEHPSGKIERYLVDGLSFAWADRRTIAGADGIWVGQVGTRSTTPPSVPVDPTLPDPESEVEVPPEIRPFQQVHTFSPGIGLSFDFEVVPFSEEVIHAFQPFIALNAFVGFRSGIPGIVQATVPALKDLPPALEPGIVQATVPVLEDPPPAQQPGIVQATVPALADPPPAQQPGIVQATVPSIS